MKLKDHHIRAIVEAGLVEGWQDLDSDDLYDEAYDVWINNAQSFRSWTARQDNGNYIITVRGVPGAYFVEAAEYDNSGPFDTIARAVSFVNLSYGEFLK